MVAVNRVGFPRLIERELSEILPPIVEMFVGSWPQVVQQQATPKSVSKASMSMGPDFFNTLIAKKQRNRTRLDSNLGHREESPNP
jgi:hypothetical protein